MADTIGDIVKRVLRITLQNPSKTGFSENDDTNLLLDLVNQGHYILRDLYPTTVDADATFTISPNVRLTVLPVTGLDIYDIYDWSWQFTDRNGKQVAMTPLSMQLVVQAHPNYKTETADYPRDVYFDDGQIGVYPFVSADKTALTGSFKYPALAVRKTAWTDTLPYPDNWILWLERFVQYNYETIKGLGNPPSTAVIMEALWGKIFGKTKRTRRIKMIGYRRPRPVWTYSNYLSNPNVW